MPNNKKKSENRARERIALWMQIPFDLCVDNKKSDVWNWISSIWNPILRAGLYPMGVFMMRLSSKSESFKIEILYKNRISIQRQPLFQTFGIQTCRIFGLKAVSFTIQRRRPLRSFSDSFSSQLGYNRAFGNSEWLSLRNLDTQMFQWKLWNSEPNFKWIQRSKSGKIKEQIICFIHN